MGKGWKIRNVQNAPWLTLEGAKSHDIGMKGGFTKSESPISGGGRWVMLALAIILADQVIVKVVIASRVRYYIDT